MPSAIIGCGRGGFSAMVLPEREGEKAILRLGDGEREIPAREIFTQFEWRADPRRVPDLELPVIEEVENDAIAITHVLGFDPCCELGIAVSADGDPRVLYRAVAGPERAPSRGPGALVAGRLLRGEIGLAGKPDLDDIRLLDERQAIEPAPTAGTSTAASARAAKSVSRLDPCRTRGQYQSARKAGKNGRVSGTCLEQRSL